MPCSTAWTRAAFDMVSSTISQIPKAAMVSDICMGAPTFSAIAAAAFSGTIATRPPAKRAGSILPSTTSASVTVGSLPPRS